jgi:hypothetical protein
MIHNMSRLVLETRDDLIPANRMMWMIPSGGSIQTTIVETTEAYFDQPKEHRGSPHAARVSAIIKLFSDAGELQSDTQVYFTTLLERISPLWESPVGRSDLEAMFPVCRSIRTFKGDLFKLHMVLTPDAEAFHPGTRMHFLKAFQQFRCDRKARRPMRSVANQRLREQLRH